MTIIAITSICASITFSYAFQFYKQYNYFSISTAKTRQVLYVIMHNDDFYRSSTNQDFVDFAYATKSGPDSSHPFAQMEIVRQKYGDVAINKITKEVLKNSGIDYFNYIFKLISLNFNTYYNGYYKVKDINAGQPVLSFLLNFVISLFVNIKYSYTYLILILESTYFIFMWAKKHIISWVAIGIITFISAIQLSTFLYTSAEYARTSVYVLVFAYLAIAHLVNVAQSLFIEKAREVKDAV